LSAPVVASLDAFSGDAVPVFTRIHLYSLGGFCLLPVQPGVEPTADHKQKQHKE
jgi:hypothetical protein